MSEQKPEKKENRAKEWVSDNLRYIILIVAIAAVIAVIVVVLMMGKAKKAQSDAEEAAAVSAMSDAEQIAAMLTPEATPTATPTPTVTVTPTQTPAAAQTAVSGELVEDHGDAAAVVNNYFKALNEHNGEAAAANVIGMNQEDIDAVSSNTRTGGYSSLSTSVLPGPDANSCVAFASYTYRQEGIDADLPGLTEFYLVKQEDGSYKMLSVLNEEQKAYMNAARNNENVQAMIAAVQGMRDQLLNADPELAAVLG